MHRSTLQPFIDKLMSELAPVVDDNHDGEISFGEFQTFSEYLTREYSKVGNASDR